MSTLYIVATPIGNLEDITLRAVKILQQVDLIAAEDTRHSSRLLAAHGIQTRMVSLHDHNEAYRATWLVEQLNAGLSVALISDAGTPLISDPGYQLVSLARAANHEVVPIPGPSALIAAMSAAGLPTDQFLFIGFLPAKSTQRQEKLRTHQQQAATIICYESPKRVLALLMDIGLVLGAERKLCLAKELTKTHENFLYGTASELSRILQEDELLQKGEFVVLIEGCPDAPETLVEYQVIAAIKEAQAYMPLNKACALVARLTGHKKNRLYEAALAFTQDNG